MHSILLQIGPLTIRSYGLCMALGFLGGWLAAARLCRRTAQSPDFLSNMLTWLMLSAVAGARLAYVVEHWRSEFADAPMAIWRIDQGGLMFYGGLVAAALVLLLYSRICHRPLLALTDLITAVLPLGHAAGRLGCFLHGCCYGRITQSAWGVSFPRESPAWWEQFSATPPLIGASASSSLAVIPTQLIEAAANLLLFAVLYRLYPAQHRQRGRITGCYLISYGALRFAIEFLRGDPRLVLGPLSIGQVISLVVALAGVYALRRASARVA